MFLVLLSSSFESQNVAAFQLKIPCPARHQTFCSEVENRNLYKGVLDLSNLTKPLYLSFLCTTVMRASHIWYLPHSYYCLYLYLGLFRTQSLSSRWWDDLFLTILWRCLTLAAFLVIEVIIFVYWAFDIYFLYNLL